MTLNGFGSIIVTYTSETENQMAYSKSSFSYSAELVWGAACAAQRINGTYSKVDFISESDPNLNTTANKTMMKTLISVDSVTAADIEQGIKVRKYFQGLTFQILKGKTLNDFQNNVLAISNRDEITTNYDIAVIACLPSSYERGVQRDHISTRIRDAAGGFIDQVKAKVSTTIEVLRTSSSDLYGCYFITGVTDKDQVVFFAFKQPVELGAKITIRGTVKAHRDNSTQLNRVKIV